MFIKNWWKSEKIWENYLIKQSSCVILAIMIISTKVSKIQRIPTLATIYKVKFVTFIGNVITTKTNLTKFNRKLEDIAILKYIYDCKWWKLIIHEELKFDDIVTLKMYTREKLYIYRVSHFDKSKLLPKYARYKKMIKARIVEDNGEHLTMLIVLTFRSIFKVIWRSR